MNISSIKTEKVAYKSTSLETILNTYVHTFSERSILVVTSKIVSLCEGRVIKTGTEYKSEIIEREAEYFLPAHTSKYDITLTINRNLLVPSAGIDESNGNGYYVLWPRDPQKTANQIRDYLCKRFSLSLTGVIITDSHTTPLRWGTTGVSIAHSGFLALNNYIGQPDIFGRVLEMTKANIADALAVSAVVVMGEGNEQTPLAVIQDVPFVRFQKRNPTDAEIKSLRINMKDDVYAPLLTSVKWKKHH